MARRTRWVQFEVPLFVRVELNDEEEYAGEISKVVLAISPGDGELTGIELAMGYDRRPRVYDGEPGEAMAEIHDDLAEQAVFLANDRPNWPAREEWEEDSDPRLEVGLYDHDEDDDPEQVTY